MYHIIIVDSGLAKKSIIFCRNSEKVRSRAMSVYWDIYGSFNGLICDTLMYYINVVYNN